MNILADENMPGLAGFDAFGKVTTCAGRNLTAADLQDTEVLLVRSVTRVNAQLLKGTPVRFVGSATIGTDHIDLDWLAANGIGFAHAPGCNAQAVVEYVLQVMLLWCDRHRREPCAQSLGIVGLGNVGQRLAEHAHALGMQVIACDPPRQRAGDTQHTWHSLDDVLECDIISLHVPLIQAGADCSVHLLGAQQLAALRDDQLLINSCRGPVIDNQALLQRLRSGPLDCVLDVWESEPQVPAELLSQVWYGSPHIAGYSLEGKLRGSWMLLKALAAWQGVTVAPPKLPTAGAMQLPINDWRDLLVWLRNAYHIEDDDQRLRDSIDVSHNVDVAAAFDAQRKNYPLRHELSAWQRSGAVTAELAGLVSLLDAR